MVDYVGQLNALPWNGIGSIQQDTDGQFVLGKYLDVDVFNAYYHCRESLSLRVAPESLHIGGPFEDFASLSAAMIDFCVKLTEQHQECHWLSDLVWTMQALSETLKNDRLKVEEWKLNDTKLVLNQTRSHFGKHTTVHNTVILTSSRNLNSRYENTLMIV